MVTLWHSSDSTSLQASVASATAVALYCSCVRRLLKKTKGYECQEADSTFMLAFEAPADAAQFCLLVRNLAPAAFQVTDSATTCAGFFLKSDKLCFKAVHDSCLAQMRDWSSMCPDDEVGPMVTSGLVSTGWPLRL